MHVDKSTLISVIKSAFSSQFEGLKLEFFKDGHAVSEASSRKSMITEDLSLGALNALVNETTIHWDTSMTVAQVEQFFEEKLGVHVQVFCKLGKSWIETSATDDYTLSKQMERSAETQ